MCFKSLESLELMNGFFFCFFLPTNHPDKSHAHYSQRKILYSPSCKPFTFFFGNNSHNGVIAVTESWYKLKLAWLFRCTTVGSLCFTFNFPKACWPCYCVFIISTWSRFVYILFLLYIFVSNELKNLAPGWSRKKNPSSYHCIILSCQIFLLSCCYFLCYVDIFCYCIISCLSLTMVRCFFLRRVAHCGEQCAAYYWKTTQHK